MKATDLILSQHHELEQIFERLGSAAEGDMKAIREEMAQNLVAHAVMEEEIFYPAMKEAMREEIARSYVEHGLLAYLLSQLLATHPRDERFLARLTVLRDLTRSHMREEETEVLKQAEMAIGDERLMRLGEEMEERFEQVKAKGYKAFLRKELEANAPRPTARRAASKKAAAKAPVKRAASQARARKAPKARPITKRRAAPSERKSATEKARGAQKARGSQKARGARSTAR